MVRIMIKKAFLFPGQGSQYVGMGKKLCETYEVARRTFEEADDALSFDLSGLCFHGDPTELTLTKNAQPAILTTGVAMFRVLQEKKIQPDYLAGHSLGEITALTCADAISFADAVRLAQRRGEFMQAAVPTGAGAMAAVMTRDVEMLKELCEKVSGEELVVISNFNTRTQQVISGNVNAVNRAIAQLTEADIKTKLLNVSAPFHCPLMKPAAERFREELKQYTLRDPKYPVIANVDAKPYEGAASIAERLTNQIVLPVRWAESMTYLKKSMVQYCAEVGAGHVLKNMMRTNISDIPVFSFESDEDALYAYAEKCRFPFVSRAMGIVVATKNNNWDDAAYQAGVIAPYNELAKLQARIEQEERKATAEEMDRTVELLLTIFATKKTPAEEQIDRLRELFADTGEEEYFAAFDYGRIHV